MTDDLAKNTLIKLTSLALGLLFLHILPTQTLFARAYLTLKNNCHTKINLYHFHFLIKDLSKNFLDKNL